MIILWVPYPLFHYEKRQPPAHTTIYWLQLASYLLGIHAARSFFYSHICYFTFHLPTSFIITGSPIHSLLVIMVAAVDYFAGSFWCRCGRGWLIKSKSFEAGTESVCRSYLSVYIMIGLPATTTTIMNWCTIIINKRSLNKRCIMST